jgi:hypothetical protein
VEEIFRARLLAAQEPHASTNSEVVPELPDLGRRLAASNEWLQSHVRSASPARLQESIRFTLGHALDLANASRPADTFTVSFTLPSRIAEEARMGPNARLPVHTDVILSVQWDASLWALALVAAVGVDGNGICSTV